MGIKIKHNLQVTSFSGVGTTFFTEFLERKTSYRLPKEFDYGVWKHKRVPLLLNEYELPKGFKVIYMFGDPRKAILSLFRRNFHIWAGQRLQCDKTKWPSIIQSTTHPPTWGLKEYVKEQMDHFELEGHFYSWRNSKFSDRGYPVLFIRYEKIWDNLELIANFLELTKKQIGRFPKKIARKSSPEMFDNEAVQSIYQIYSDFYNRLLKEQDIFLI